eukprot:CFRG4115T1
MNPNLPDITVAWQTSVWILSIIHFAIPFAIYIGYLSTNDNFMKILRKAERERPQAEDISESIGGADTDKDMEVDRPVILTFRNIGYSVKTSKGPLTILHGVTVISNVVPFVCIGVFKPGRLAAIMGPSGCGKSTLLDILADRKGNEGRITGNIHVNGYARNRMFTRVASYVMQSDCLFTSLTVRETLLFIAEFRMSQELSTEEKMLRVDQVIRDLDLTKVCNTHVGDDSSGGLSGGQKRRVTVAIEMISKPSILFLDEPTSGLDAYGSLRLVQVLKRLADRGHTIVCTIHQPRSDIFKLFNDLFLMKAGRVMYSGLVRDVMSHFEAANVRVDYTSNPADFVVDLTQYADEENPYFGSKDILEIGTINASKELAATGDLPTKENEESNSNAEMTVKRDQLEVFYKNSSSFKEMISYVESVENRTLPELPRDVGGITSGQSNGKGPNSSRYATSTFHQVRMLSLRTYMAQIRNGAYVAGWFVGAITFLFYGTLYVNLDSDIQSEDTEAALQNILVQSAFIYQLLGAMFFNEAPTVASVFLEKEMLRRDSASGTYSFTSYHLCWFLRLTMGAFTKGILYTPLVYFLGNLPLTLEKYFLFTLYMIIMDSVGTSLALLTASVLSALDSAAAAFVTLNICAQNLSGFFIAPSLIGAWLIWLYYILFFKYGLEGLYCVIYGDLQMSNGIWIIPTVLDVDTTLNAYSNALVFMIYPIVFHVLAFGASVYGSHSISWKVIFPKTT